MLPATTLLVIIFLYGLIALFGAVDIDLIDIDLDMDVDSGSPTSIGMATLKFLNLGDVPIIIWLVCFGFVWWSASLLLWIYVDGMPEELSSATGTFFILRNIGMGLVGAKVLTEPLQHMFDETEQYTPEKVIGRTCEISTSEVTDSVGQARVKTDAAPLLIDVRADEGEFEKGEIAIVVGYAPEKKTYFIQKVTEEITP